MLRGRQVGIGSTLIKLAVIGQRLCHSTKFEQLGKSFIGLFGGSQLDDLPELFGLLAADGGQLAETVARVLFENAERIATSDGGVLAGVARHHHPAVGAQGLGVGRAHVQRAVAVALAPVGVADDRVGREGPAGPGGEDEGELRLHSRVGGGFGAKAGQLLQKFGDDQRDAVVGPLDVLPGVGIVVDGELDARPAAQDRLEQRLAEERHVAFDAGPADGVGIHHREAVRQRPQHGA